MGDLAGTHVRQHQRGFLPKRFMLANVEEIDHLSHMFDFEHNDAALILYDFTAAFPSIARQVTLDALAAFGARPQVIAIMSIFYQRNQLHI